MKANRILGWLLLLVALSAFAGVAVVHHFAKSNARERAALSDTIKAME